MSVYRHAAVIARNVHLGQGLRSQLYSSNIVKDKKDLPSISFLVSNTLQKLNELDELISKVGLSWCLTSESDTWFVRVLVTELILGRKSFHSDCKLMKDVYSKKSELKTAAAEMKVSKKPEVLLPRYVRVNTENVSMVEAHQYLKKKGYNKAQSAKAPKQYSLDPHVPGLLVFHEKASIQGLDWLDAGNLILQDKSSCLVAHILAPHPNATILDMCAAPGFKTQHVAAVTSRLGKIVAVDIDEKRYDSLCKMKEKFSLENLICVNSDALDLKKLEPYRRSVEYILLDPPCSGTGMVKNHDFTANAKPDSERYSKLHNLQVKLLRSALTDYPAARRVTYSTCSITEEENELVIEEILSNLPGGFTHVDLTPFFPGLSRGLSSYKCGSKCIRLSPDADRTNGFFIAMFERLDPPAHPARVQLSPNLKRSADDISSDSSTKKIRTDKEEKMEESEESVDEDSDVSGDDIGDEVTKAPNLPENGEKIVKKAELPKKKKEIDDLDEDEDSDDSEEPAELSVPSTKAAKPDQKKGKKESQESLEDGSTADESLEDESGEEDDQDEEEDDEDEDGEEEEDDDDEEEEGSEEEGPAKDDKLVASEENGQDQPGYGKPREFWGRGHKRFGDRGGGRGGSEGWRGRGRGGRGGGDRGGRGGGDRGGWRGRGDGQRGGRGGSWRGHGGDRGGWRGRGGERGGRGSFRGSERGGRGSPRGGSRGGSSPYHRGSPRGDWRGRRSVDN